MACDSWAVASYRGLGRMSSIKFSVGSGSALGMLNDAGVRASDGGCDGAYLTAKSRSKFGSSRSPPPSNDLDAHARMGPFHLRQANEDESSFFPTQASMPQPH